VKGSQNLDGGHLYISLPYLGEQNK
jgi:hypothetical protein